MNFQVDTKKEEQIEEMPLMDQLPSPKRGSKKKESFQDRGNKSIWTIHWI